MNLSDEQLCVLAKSDERATETLIDRYKGQVISLARKYYLRGGDIEDLISEGMIGLYKAIMSFDNGNKAAFSTYSYVCISRQLINAVKKSANTKNAVLNGSLSLDDAESLGGGVNPEEVFQFKEAEKRLDELLKNNLSGFEYDALKLYLNGLPYKEIADKLKTDSKSVDNALSRAKKKIAAKLGV